MKAMKPANILIVDDDRGHLTSLRTVIRSWGYEVTTVEDGRDAVAAVKDSPVDLILMDVRMTTMSGIEALAHIKRYNPSIPIIIMTAYSSVESAVEALKGGAYDYLIKPFDFDVLKLSIERACEHAGLKAENEDLRARLQEDFDRPDIIGKSASMKVPDGYAGHGGAFRSDRADYRGERHRQGVDRADRCISTVRARTTRWLPSIVRHLPKACWNPSCSATRRGPLRAPIDDVKAVSCRPTAGRFFWMKSAKRLPACRPSCFAYCRKKKFSVWAAKRFSTWMCGS